MLNAWSSAGGIIWGGGGNFKSSIAIGNKSLGAGCLVSFDYQYDTI